MKSKNIIFALIFTISSFSAIARLDVGLGEEDQHPLTTVTCIYSDGFGHWTEEATESWTVGDMVRHCTTSGGTAYFY